MRARTDDKGKRERNELVFLFVWHWLLGFLISAGLVSAIIYFDFDGLGGLLTGEPLAIGMLWFFAGSTFAAVQTAMTVMAMTDDGGSGGGGKRQMSGLKALFGFQRSRARLPAAAPRS